MAKLLQETREKYAAALLDAFPRARDFEDLYRAVFQDELGKICSVNDPLKVIVDAILTQCAAQDKCQELIPAALVMNPSNKKLAALAAEIAEAEKKSRPADEPADSMIGFVNRKKELEAIFLNPGQISRYWVIDAPAGYGKSQLLAEVEKRYKKDNWLTVKVGFPRRVDPAVKWALLDWIARPILAQLNTADPKKVDDSQSPEDIGMDIAVSILAAVRKESPVGKIQGVVISVDNFENCPDADVPGLMQLLSGIFNGLSNNGDFFQSRHLRVFISGRYARNKIKNARDQIMMADMPLAPFTFDVILDTIQEFAISKGISGGLKQAPDIAAHLMHITGGHPGFTAEVFSDLAKDDFARGVRPLVRNGEQYQRQFTEKFYDQLTQEAPKVRDHQLIEILVNLSPFRKYERWFFLKELKERHHLPADLSEEEIEKGLLSTYLVDRYGGFLSDGIYRYLLEIWLRLQKPDLYADLCQAGIEIYKKQLESRSNVRRVDKWAIEYLYLSIECNHYVKQIKGQALVEQTQQDMMWVVSTLADMKNSLSESDVDGMREDFINGLRSDTELRFLYNFCTSPGDHFETKSFEELLTFANQEFDKFF